ncbi:host-nuclease inhibitor Gam family protein [Rhodospirillum sp. A1_3_36]|uniref:host-nuclease inhibitor Gam family protein n=1 Tax=Rhodospirillum sp. A1_3_36 TaxID=3391666 RepID=UPI0039A6551A
MTSLADIEALTKKYSDAHRALKDEVAGLEDEINAIKRRRIARLRALVDTSATAYAVLSAAIEDAPELFVKPKTLVFHGIKIGFSKGKGKLEYADAAKVVQLIRKHFEDKFDDLVKVEEKPVRGALNLMSVAELRKIGVTVVEAGDEVVIKATDGEIDKMVDALLSAAKDEEAA